jgi:NADPH2 dehydrogenase
MNRLFSEIPIGNVKIKNRIVMPPMVCLGYTNADGMVTEKNRRHYEERARGGVGLIIVEATCINPSGRLADRQLGLWSDEQIEGFHKIAEVCHRYGAKVLVQIHHAGLKTPGSVTADIVAPSDYRETFHQGGKNIAARALTVAEIHTLQADFAAAALRAQKAGLDGVELHGAHSYLISQFFSPLVNQRTDDYGGSITNRAHFAVEIIASIRAQAGKDFIIGCRMGGNEPDLEGGIAIARELEKAGADLLHVSSGMDSPDAKELQIPDDFRAHSPNYNWIVYGGTQVKKNVQLPVIVVNNIKTPEQANYLIENKLADFTAIGRGLLVDPEWANKAAENEAITTCLGCKPCARFRSIEACPRYVK